MSTYRVELDRSDCIDGISLTNSDNVISASLVSGNTVLVTVKPKAGRLEFWDDFYLSFKELAYTSLYIEITLYNNDRMIIS